MIQAALMQIGII